MNIYGVFGSGGYGREVMPLLQNSLKNDYSKIVFVVDDLYKTTNEINGVDVFTFTEFLLFDAVNKFITIAIGDSEARKHIFERCVSNNLSHYSLVADNVVLMTGNELGEGMILSPFVTITSNCKIGKAFHGNLYSYIGHDCIIGDYVTFSPGVKCSGNVIIENNVFVGTGAIIRPGSTDKPLVISEGAIIGMGSVITKNVKAGTTVFGNPAKPIGR